MAGEGACFLVCPPGVAPRPRDTGWYAAFGALAAPRDPRVAYAPGGMRFMGATFDPSALYRFNAVMKWLDQIGVDAADIHARAQALQAAFIQQAAILPGFGRENLVVPAGSPDRGNFLAYRSPQAAAWQASLAAGGILTDVRGDVLRVGFGLYHDVTDVPDMVARMAAYRPGPAILARAG
jgi:selenocysteine lyase/cysteine desulfurase